MFETFIWAVLHVHNASRQRTHYMLNGVLGVNWESHWSKLVPTSLSQIQWGGGGWVDYEWKYKIFCMINLQEMILMWVKPMTIDNRFSKRLDIRFWHIQYENQIYRTVMALFCRLFPIFFLQLKYNMIAINSLYLCICVHFDIVYRWNGNYFKPLFFLDHG